MKYMIPTILLLLALAAGLAVVGIFGERHKPVRIGYAGQLTGPQADLGVQGRNGAQLAVESINAQGGIEGRLFELMPVDDLGTPEGAVRAVRELAELKAAAIVGFMTSNQSLAALPVAEELGIVIMSPTTSSSKLSGKKDFFFRVQPAVTSPAYALATYARRNLGLDSVSAVYDRDNKSYTESFLQAFRERYEQLGGHMPVAEAFSAKNINNYPRLLYEVMRSDPQGLLIIASAYDTAIIAQTYQRGDWSAPLFFSTWSYTEKLLHMGGHAVDGAYIMCDFNPQNNDPAYVDFHARFEKRFGMQPGFAAAQAYDAVMILAQALKRAGMSPMKLPEALTGIKDFSGVNGEISLDAYGDVVRKSFLVTVRQGRFVLHTPINEQ